MNNPANTASAAPPAKRYLPLDAARGFVMIYLCTDGFGLSKLQGGAGAARVASWFDHVRWDGFVPWELVMPSFMFMIGAALPFALARRERKGEPFSRTLRHALRRTLILILFGQMLWSLYAGRYRFDPIETLTQLALSYFGCLLILQLRFRWQVVAAAALMALNWGLYAAFPGPQGAFDPTAAVGIRIDRALFGLDHSYDWQVINFLGSTVTVLFGAWTATLLRSGRPQKEKLTILAGAAAASLLAGLALSPFIPIIHKCWTASYTFIHTACVLAMILFFVVVFGAERREKYALPFVVVGMNSIFIYLVSNSLSGGWLDPTLAVFTGKFWFLGMAGPVVQAWAVFLAMWGLCYWLYRRRIFFKL